ncbi:MAG: 50S ribosomal protein L25 [Akkermansia sp.]|nr:50S ribosomal protein L25 [Akkermansia sp.]
MTNLTLKVSKREVRGTGKLNALRAQGFMPGVVYGPAVQENINIQVKVSDVRSLLNSVDSDSFLVNLDLDGTTILAMVKDVQRNFLTDTTNHMDFEAVTPDTVVKTKVEVKLTGTPVGVGMGGVVHQIVHEVPVKCAVKDIPCCITGDITAVKMGESFRLGQIELPANVSSPFNGTVVLASIVKP